ncbi:MAG: MMPL family transporter [SAR202 cluster bacterium]|nr:MMPL family transporter [SAR202 cluster bacterium]
MVSDDRRTIIIPLTMAGDFDDATNNIGQVVDVVDEADARGDFEVLITGQAAVGKDFQEVGQEGMEKGETVGVPVALIILVLLFGAVIAAFIPLVLALVSIFVALGAAALVGQFFALSFFVTNIIFMIGLAVGIDYSLFIVARYREERAKGHEKLEAIVRTGRTANRAVFFSGVTVVIALIGMLLVPFNVFVGLGIGAILVVICSMLAALTLLPAVLSLLGDRINKLSIPFVGDVQARFDEQRSGGFWDRVSHGVMRQPIISLLLGGGLLIAAAVPLLNLSTGFAGVSTMPDTVPSKRGFDILDAKFTAGDVTPAQIVIDGDIDSPAVREGIDNLTALLESDPEQAFGTPLPEEVSAQRDLLLLSVPVAGDSAEDVAQDAITRLRSEYIPAAFGTAPGTQVYVTGETAFNLDFFTQATSAAWIVFPFVLGVSFLLLMVVFRSIVVPLKAILLNLLSVGATYGILVLTFQNGWGEKLGLLKQFDIIEAWIPLFLFSILFGLSMDYHVFLLSRIRERFDQTQDNTASVAFGIRSTVRLITGAALIMVSVFWAFSAGDIIGLQQMGFGLGIAILLDATIVRMVLVPSSMRLLGKWNWYLPSGLNWLPDFRVEAAHQEESPALGD